MKFTVVWAGTAEAALAEFWLRVDDRRQISDAARMIDRALGLDPEGIGEAREFDQRVIIVPP